MAESVGIVSIEKQWFNEKEALFYIGIKDRKFLRDMRQKGELNNYGHGVRVVYKKSELDAMMESGRQHVEKVELSVKKKSRNKPQLLSLTVKKTKKKVI